MKLTRIKSTGVKGQTLDAELKPITLVCGENAAGKSALLAAARILLTAKNPLEHKAPIKVVGMIDGGQVLTREWNLNKGAAKAAHELPDGWPETPVVLLDPLDYLDRSERERAKYVSSLVRSADTSGDWVVQKVRGLTFESPTREIILEHEAQCQSVHHAMAKIVPADVTLQDVVESLVAEWATKASTDKATVDRLKGFGAAQVQLQSSDTQVATRNVDTELRQASERLGKARADLNALLDREQKAKNVVERSERLQRTLAGLTDKSAEIATLEAELNAEQAEINQYVSRSNEIGAKLSPLTLDLAMSRNKVNYQCSAVEHAENEIKAVMARECPCCGQSGDVCMANKRAIDRERRKIEQAQNELATLRAIIDGIEAKMPSLREQQQQSAADDRANQQRKQGMAVKWTALSQLRAQQSAFLKATEEFRNIGELAPPTAESIEVARQNVEDITKTVVMFTDMQKRHAAAQQEEARRQQSIKELTDAEARQTVTKAVRQAILEAQAELVERLFGGLLQTINRVAGGLVETAIEFHDGEIGRHSTDGAWVSHRDFSGFERAVTYAGIAAALAKDAPVKLVLVDDLIISRQNKHRLLSRFMELIRDGVVDQLLLTDCDTDDYAEFVTHHSNVFGVVEV